MSKPNTLQKFFIDNNLQMTDQDLARATGLSIKQIHARRRKQEGLNRSGKAKSDDKDDGVASSTERVAQLEHQSQLAAKEQEGKLLPVENRPAPSMRIDALIARQSGTTALTGPASQLADLFDGIGPDSKGPVVPKYDPFADNNRVHKIKR